MNCVDLNLAISLLLLYHSCMMIQCDPVKFLCTFDAYSSLNVNVCGATSFHSSGNATINAFELNALPGSGNEKYITDITSLYALTFTNKTCNIPFTYNEQDSHFCVLKDSQFVCETAKDSQEYDECNLGKFLRVRSNTNGEAFKLSFNLDTPLRTKRGNTYNMSFYTLINCPKVGCEEAKDTISIKIKDGADSQFQEVYSVSGRVRDDRWIKEEFSFTVSEQSLYIRFDFSRDSNQGSGDGVASMFIDHMIVFGEFEFIIQPTVSSSTTPTLQTTSNSAKSVSLSLLSSIFLLFLNFSIK